MPTIPLLQGRLRKLFTGDIHVATLAARQNRLLRKGIAMHSPGRRRVWVRLAAGLVAFSTINLSAQLRAAEGAPDGESSRQLRGDARTFVYLNVNRFQLGVPHNNEFYDQWRSEVEWLLSGSSGVDAAAAEHAACLTYDDGIVVAYWFSAPLNHDDALSWFGSDPWRPRSDPTACFRFTDSETRVLAPGDRTLLVSHSATALERFRRLTEQQLAPEELLSDAGGAGSDVLLTIGRPFPGDLRSMVTHQLLDSDGEAADGLLAGLDRISLAVKPADEVPLRLTLRADSDAAAESIERLSAAKLAQLQQWYEATGRDELLADELVPDTDVLIADVDRLVRGARVTREGEVVEVVASAPGGMPRFFELCLHEFARASLWAQHTRDKVSDEFGEFGELEIEAGERTRP